MILQYMFRSAVLLPLVGPAVATAAVLARGHRRRQVLPGLLPALLLLLPTFLLAQCLLSLASWCMQPLAEAGATPRYAPWYAELLLAPVCYLYLRVLTGQPRRPRLVWRRLLPGLGHIGLFAGVALLDLGYRHGVAAAQFGDLGPVACCARCWPRWRWFATCYCCSTASKRWPTTARTTGPAPRPVSRAGLARGAGCWSCCCWVSAWA